ncbi:MAG: AAA domain-containing protein [Methylococcaceae bacterium]|jgi:very-short-patch-repair endonuclease
MAVEHDRLLSLIEFAQQTAMLRLNPITDVAKHNVFHEFEHSLQSLPGIHLNSGGDEDEIWFVIDRLHESPAPAPQNELLQIWIDLPNTPFNEPSLKSAVESQKLIDGEFIIPDLVASKKDLDAAKKLVLFSEFEKCEEVEKQLKLYIEKQWNEWAIAEKKRRRTISLYAKLFTLKQQLEGAITDAQLELVCGSGVAVWKMGNVYVTYPLVTRLVEIELNSNMAIEIRPRDVDFRLEYDIYAAEDNLGIPDLDIAYKEFIAKATQTFSPFDRSSFEPLLQLAVTYLDSKGVYWANQTTPDDRQLPKATAELKVTDTWVLFARPRSKSILIQDLERFKKTLNCENAADILSDAIKAIVTDPSSEHKELDLPSFRGLSMVCGTDAGSTSKNVSDLFFPLSFNDEQVRIVQLLECSNGVVVQGPPGTGKTHTIANIISHYLAFGKRVLVTSMKDPALSVLRDKLPEEIRPLAISLLSSEQEGMKQFEFAITKIASEVQRIDCYSLAREISQVEQKIDLLHAKLANIDRNIANWADKNLKPINLDGEQIHPEVAAQEVIKGVGNYEWLSDKISVSSQCSPQFNDAEIVSLREARRHLGKDLEYLNAILPEIHKFPDSRELLKVHQDLSRCTELQASIEAGEVPPLADSTDNTFKNAEILLETIRKLYVVNTHIEQSNKAWAVSVRQRIKNLESQQILSIFEQLGDELKTVIAERSEFVAKPVTIPVGIEKDDELIKGIANKADGKSAFGIGGIIGKGGAKKKLEAIQIINTTPKSEDDWQYVHRYVSLQKRMCELATRWNSIAQEIEIDVFAEIEPAVAVKASENFVTYSKIKESVTLEGQVIDISQMVFPSWEHHHKIAEQKELLEELQKALEHHFTRNRLSETWALKEKLQQLLSPCCGYIVDLLKSFVAQTLGNPSIADADMQAQWSVLMDELRRIHGLSGCVANVKDISNRIAESGAPKWAEMLKYSVLDSTVDNLLPDHWQIAWRLRRLATYLNAADGREELKVLTRDRHGAERDLAKSYQEVVSKRTWLKLSENATPDIRSALESFRIAIAKIGKGTGKRAIRYRQDARYAASRANKAIPCWIMSHYRVSESLPPDFGCFDLVIIDEASQSDLTALPAILRAKKILIVGDDKQVSPDGIGLEEAKINNLITRFLVNQVDTYRPQMTPERSIYDLLKVVFAGSSVMLKEHFRCVSSIIEYSKREFYNHELKPVRLPRSSERLDPPLVDVVVEDGYRKGDVNPSEVRFIVDEIKAICDDPNMAERSIGVVSLLADKQSLEVWKMLEKELSAEIISRHKIACGDARTFQGKERDIMFLSMVVSPQNNSALGKESFAQRFNVAASRARDRMYLVRSVELNDLSPADTLRRGLIHHFASPYAQNETTIKDLRELCESPFECEIYDILIERGYKVIPQLKVGEFRLDMVVEGHHDARLAIECDGDRYHGMDKWADDMNRQRILERVGWRFWRCFASTYVMNRKEIIEDLIHTLREHGIEPIGSENAPNSIHSEQRRVKAFATEEQTLFDEEDVETA